MSLHTIVHQDTAITTPMSRDEARNLTDEIRRTADRTWQLILVAYEREAWRVLGYATFREYATREFEFSQSRAYQLLNHGRTVKAIEQATNFSTTVEITERQARRIKPLLNEVTSEIRTRIEQGEAPEAAVDAVVTTTIEERADSDDEIDERDQQPTDAHHDVEAVVAAKLGPPSNGRQFSRIALRKLSEIRDHDLEREQAFDEVQRFLDARFNPTKPDRTLSRFLRTLKALKTGALSVGMIDNFATCMSVEARRFEELSRKRHHANHLKSRAKAMADREKPDAITAAIEKLDADVQTLATTVQAAESARPAEKEATRIRRARRSEPDPTPDTPEVRRG